MRSRIILSALALATIVGMVAIAGTGNGAPSGQHYNLNIIGVPNPKQVDFDGGNGSRIFVSRTGSTWFYVHGGTSYDVLDRNGTDGKVGTSISDPGIVFPYEGIPGLGGQWKVQIYVRLLGPKDSTVDWSTYVPSFLAGKPTIVDGSTTWYLYESFQLDRTSTKFQLKTSQLLPDAYQDVLWVLDPTNKFRIVQMRIYLEEE